MKDHSNLVDIIRLIRTPNITELTFAKLIEDFGNATTAIEGISAIMQNAKKPFNIPSVSVVEKEIAEAHEKNISIVAYTDEYYPPLLRQLENFPPILFAKGNTKLLKKSSIAIVGTRNATIQGQQNASKFAKELGEHGFLVVSGMAKGIDTAAHEAALAKGTVAVLGCGVDKIYPTSNTKLYQQIVENGVVISEFPLGTPPMPYHFPKRNRIISGMSRGILVVEAALNSGSLITAELALNQGRDVFVLSGGINDTKYFGNHSLIKDGAIFTTETLDIINVVKKQTVSEHINDKYQHTLPKLKEFQQMELAPVRKYLMEVLSSDPISIDTIVKHNSNNFDSNQINYAIIELEISGQIERHPNNKISLIHTIK
ncbi:MAG: DNA-processing protein DprA [Alphaproteobacteria bacterium]|jgi:DNA processing protein|nr:DNA-processing protein DprA [Alphaproteobacteria bacterium]